MINKPVECLHAGGEEKRGAVSSKLFLPQRRPSLWKQVWNQWREHLLWFSAWALHHAGSECASFATHHLDSLCFAITYSSHPSLSVHWCSEERNALRNDWNMAPRLPLKLWASAVVNGPLSWNKSVQCQNLFELEALNSGFSFLYRGLSQRLKSWEKKQGINSVCGQMVVSSVGTEYCKAREKEWFLNTRHANKWWFSFICSCLILNHLFWGSVP